MSIMFSEQLTVLQQLQKEELGPYILKVGYGLENVDIFIKEPFLKFFSKKRRVGWAAKDGYYPASKNNITVFTDIKDIEFANFMSNLGYKVYVS